MSSSSRKITEHEQGYQRHADILRNNLQQWDLILTTTGEEWPENIGRFNAAMNQIANMDREIDAIFDHFVFLPIKSPANPQDIPLFLSTRVILDENEKSNTGCAPLKDDNKEEIQARLYRMRGINIQTLPESTLLIDQIKRMVDIVNQSIQDYEDRIERFA